MTAKSVVAPVSGRAAVLTDQQQASLVHVPQEPDSGTLGQNLGRPSSLLGPFLSLMARRPHGRPTDDSHSPIMSPGHSGTGGPD